MQGKRQNRMTGKLPRPFWGSGDLSPDRRGQGGGKAGKRLLALGVSAVLVLGMLAGCGRSGDGAGDDTGALGEGSASGASGEPAEYTYRTSYLDFPSAQDSDSLYYGTSDAQVEGGVLYLTEYRYSAVDAEGNPVTEEADAEKVALTESVGSIVGFSLDGEMKEVFRADTAGVLEMPSLEGGNETYRSTGISNFCFAPDGSILAVASASAAFYDDAASYYESEDSIMLVRFSADGTVLDSRELDEEIQYASGLACDADGNLAIAANEQLLLLSPEWETAGRIDLGENGWINGVYSLGGKVYTAGYGENGFALKEVDFAGQKYGAEYTELPSNADNYAESADGEQLLCSGSSGLYLYSLSEQSAQQLLRWSDIDIVGDYIRGVFPNGGTDFYAVYSDWTTDETQLVELTRVRKDELPPVTELVLATFYENQSLSRDVVSFNKNHDDVHLTIKSYYDWENDSDITPDDAYTNLVNDVTGSNPPDMLCLSDLEYYGNPEELAQKGLFEDLRTYLASSAVLSEGDFVENVLDFYRSKDGILYAVPYSFSVSTIVGGAEDLGTEPGWTIREFTEYAKAHPDASLFEYASRGYIGNTLLQFAVDDFVDWESGECRFDSADFRELLEYIASLPEEIVWDESDMRGTPTKIADGDVLTTFAYLSEALDIQEYNAMFTGRGGACFIGFPTPDGTPTAMAQAGGEAVAILSSAEKKESAWEFVEFYLTQDYNNYYSYGIPSRKADLDAILEKQIAEKYGEGNGLGWGDWEYTYHALTREEADKYLEVVRTARMMNPANTEILTIIEEEAEGFYSAQKSLDDVIKVIQSRVSMYVLENK